MITGWAAVNASGDVAIRQTQAVVAVARCGLIGEAGTIQRGEQPVAGAVAGEDAAGAITAVRRGSETTKQQSRFWVAEARQRPTPVCFIAIRGPFLLGNL